MAFLYCDRAGVIHIGSYTPEGMLPLGKGSRGQLTDAIGGLARLAYDNKTMLVPGVPEAQNDDEALEAARRFRDRFDNLMRSGLVRGRKAVV